MKSRVIFYRGVQLLAISPLLLIAYGLGIHQILWYMISGWVGLSFWLVMFAVVQLLSLWSRRQFK